jgi:hypothetical protein
MSQFILRSQAAAVIIDIESRSEALARYCSGEPSKFKRYALNFGYAILPWGG